jgi:hypothetical protein
LILFQESNESHFDVWNGNFNHIPLLQPSQIQQNSLDSNYHTYYTLSESIHYYGASGLTNEINIDNEYSNTTLLSATPVTIPDGVAENNFNQFYGNSGSLNYFNSANISNEVVCEHEPINAYVDSSVSGKPLTLFILSSSNSYPVIIFVNFNKLLS